MASAALLTTNSATNTRSELERGTVLELLIAAIDLFTGQGAEAIHPELFATEASHDGAVDDGAAQVGKIDIAIAGRNALSREVADEAAREAIARSGGVEHILEQIAGHHEALVLAE